MKKVSVLRLSGCSYCQELVKKLDAEKVIYSSIDADVESETADEVEALIQAYIYPIVMISSAEGSTQYLFRADNIIDLRTTQIPGGAKTGVRTIDEMVSFILKNT